MFCSLTFFFICQTSVYLKAHDKQSGSLAGTQSQGAQMKPPEAVVVKH